MLFTSSHFQNEHDITLYFMLGRVEVETHPLFRLQKNTRANPYTTKQSTLRRLQLRFVDDGN